MPTPHSSSSRSSAQSSLTVLWIVDKNAKKVQYKSGCMITLHKCQILLPSIDFYFPSQLCRFQIKHEERQVSINLHFLRIFWPTVGSVQGVLRSSDLIARPLFSEETDLSRWKTDLGLVVEVSDPSEIRVSKAPQKKVSLVSSEQKSK